MRSPEGETLFDTQEELDDQLWFLPLRSLRMWLTVCWGCFIACVSLPSSADLFLQSRINSSSGRDRPSGVCCPENTDAVCAHPTSLSLPHWGTGLTPISRLYPWILLSHLSMLIAQRFRMLAVHIITSMVTKISQQIRLNVQTPPVTCISDTKLSALLCTRF